MYVLCVQAYSTNVDYWLLDAVSCLYPTQLVFYPSENVDGLSALDLLLAISSLSGPLCRLPVCNLIGRGPVSSELWSVLVEI